MQLHAIKKVAKQAFRETRRTFRGLNKVIKKERQNSPRLLSPSDLRRLMGMDYERFSHLFPYRYFDDEDELFINTESVGFACEISPLAGANEEIINSIADMIKSKLDHTVCVQVMLVGSNEIEPVLNGVVSGYLNSDDMFKELGLSQYRYLKHAGINGFSNKRQIEMPLRDYRCFIFVSKRSGYNKAIAAKMCDLREDIMTELKNAGLYNIKMDVLAFLSLMKSLINRHSHDIAAPKVKIDQYKELHEQIVDPDFELKVYPRYLESQVDGSPKTQIVALSLKELPDEVALWSQADNFANIIKPNMSIPCPFVISVHFKCEPKERSKIKAFRKANGYEKKANSPYAKLIPGIVQAAEDWKKIRDDLAIDAIKLCKISYNCILFTDEKHRRDHVSKTLATFRVNGFDLYSVKYQQLQSYLSIMPFVAEQGLWHDLSLLGRLNTMTTWNLSNLLPLVAEYKGSQDRQGVLAPTFRHQAACINNFDESLINFNACISAASGAGKSVLAQGIIAANLASGGKVWVIDVGESYKKFCQTIGGTYMNAFNLRLNPFSTVTDISRSAVPIRDLLAVMASPDEGLGDVQKAHLLNAVIDAYNKKKNNANIDDVISYLQSIDQSKGYDQRIDDVVTLLEQYSPTASGKGSMAARIFNETSLLEPTDPLKERFAVLELVELEDQPSLLKSVLFALILNIESQFYHGNRDRKKVCIIDEAWKLLKGSNQIACDFINNGFRTGRRYNGSFIVISQKMSDFYESSEAQAAWACSESKIIMRQNEKEFKSFLIKNPDLFTEYQQRIIQNFKGSANNGFSEFMVEQGSVSSFHRLFIDPFARVMFSSRAEDHQAVHNLVEQGVPIAEAIRQVAQALYGDEMQRIALTG